MHNDFWFRLLTLGAVACFAFPFLHDSLSISFDPLLRNSIGSSVKECQTVRATQLSLDHGLLPEAFIWANDHYDFGMAIGQMFSSQIHERITSDLSLQHLIEFCKVRVRRIICLIGLGCSED